MEPSRYICLICYRELPRADEACPHCKTRASSTVGASPRTLVSLLVVLATLLAVTSYLSSSFHAVETSRAERHAERARQLAALGDHEGSIGEYREALTYSRDNLDYRLSLTVALYEAGRLAEAETYLTELGAADPTLAVPNFYLARIAEVRGDVEAAVSYYRSAVYGRWPADPLQRRIETRFALVSLLERQGEPMQAVAELVDLREEVPDNRDVASRVAWSLLLTGAPGRALEVFEDLVTQDPDDAVAYSGIAEAAFELDHYLTARTNFRRALSLDPRLTHLQERVALCDEIILLDPTVRGLGRVSRYERSLELLERTLAVLDQCIHAPGDGVGPVQVTSAVATDRAIARSWIDGEEPRSQDDDTTEENLLLVERLWRASQQCADAQTADPALSRLVRKLSTT
jgi:tetratricopeptide (TPR) repeat protein